MVGNRKHTDTCTKAHDTSGREDEMRLDSGGQTAVAAIGLPPWPTLRFGARSGEQARRTRGAQVKLGGVDVAVAVVAVASVGLWVALWLRERRFYELIFSLGASWNSGEFRRAHVCAFVHTDRQTGRQLCHLLCCVAILVAHLEPPGSQSQRTTCCSSMAFLRLANFGWRQSKAERRS